MSSEPRIQVRLEATATCGDVISICALSGEGIFLVSIVGRLAVVKLAVGIPHPLVLGPEIR